MPQPRILRIAEIFPSIQGEGLRQGEPTLFIRLSGCNLRCSFCDTKYAWKKGRGNTVENVIEKIKELRQRFPSRWVCLTGGEPLLQDIDPLVRGLKKEGFKIQLETNAVIYRNLAVDWYSISPKPEKYFFQPQYRRKAKEIKLVVTRNLSLELVKKLRKKFPDKTPILLQPQSSRKWSMKLGTKLLNQALRAGLNNVKLSIQLHKVYALR
jgi:7-carboxy-7-deazaguanine synthase